MACMPFAIAFATWADHMSLRQEWKIEGPQSERWATVEKAIIYVKGMRDKSNDPTVKKNANKTIAILKRLQHPCGSGSAC